MLDPSLWSFTAVTGEKFEVLTANGTPEVFTYVEPSQNTATADFITLWASRYNVVGHLLGNGFNLGPALWPGRTDLFARRAVIAGIKPTGFASGWVEYVYAKINVTFQPNPGGQIGGSGGNTFIEVSSENTAEYMTLPDRQMVWNAPASGFHLKALTEPPHKLITKKTHTVTVHQWAFPSFTQMDAALGKINQNNTTWIGRTIPAGTLLFNNYSEKFDTIIAGISTYHVDMTFLEKPTGWNKMIAKDGNFHETDPLLYEDDTFVGVFP